MDGNEVARMVREALNLRLPDHVVRVSTPPGGWPIRIDVAIERAGTRHWALVGTFDPEPLMDASEDNQASVIAQDARALIDEMQAQGGTL